MIKKLLYTTRDELLAPDVQSIWTQAEALAFARRKLGRQCFIYVNGDSFAKLQHHFTPEPFRPGHWRTNGNIIHLHAVKESPTCINIHVDFLNPSRNPVLMLGHFFTDVLPTAIWASYRQRRLVLRPFYQPE